MILVSVGQPTIVHDGQFAVNLTPVVDRHRPFLCGFKRGQIERLQQRRVAGKYTALAVQSTVRGIQAFNGIGGIDDRPHITEKLEDRTDHSPIVILTLHGAGILLLPNCRDFIQCFSSFRFGWCIVDRFQIFGKRLSVLVRYILQRIPQRHGAAEGALSVHV